MRTPALDAWRREMAAGERTRETCDPLWRAACAEMNALESAHVPELAADFLDESRRIIREAVKRQQGAA